MDIAATRDEVLAILEAIPRVMLTEEVAKLLGCHERVTQMAVETDFRMPARSLRSLQDHPDTSNNAKSGAEEEELWEFKDPAVYELHKLNNGHREVSDDAEGYDVSGLIADLGSTVGASIMQDSRKMPLLDQSFRIDIGDDVADDMCGVQDTHGGGALLDTLASRAAHGRREEPLSSHLELSSKEKVLKFIRERQEKGRLHQETSGKIAANEFEISDSVPEEGEVQRMLANINLQPHLTADQVEQCDFSRLYKDAGSVRREVGPLNIADPVKATPVQKSDKWTFELLIESKPLIKYTHMVLEEFRKSHERIYKKTGVHHRLEWCLLVDNSGSMMTKATQSAEALAVVIQVLRWMECRFAIARFGNRGRQRMLKCIDDPFSNYVGQQILESFSYDEGTYTADAVANIAAKVWPGPLEGTEKLLTHRVMLMIVDGLTRELHPEDYRSVTGPKDIDLVVLNIKDKAQEGVMQQIEQLWEDAAEEYKILDTEDIDDLPSILISLMQNAYERALSGAVDVGNEPLQSPAALLQALNVPRDEGCHTWPMLQGLGKMNIASRDNKDSPLPAAFRVSPLGSRIPHFEEALAGWKGATEDEAERQDMVDAAIVDKFYSDYSNSAATQKASQSAADAWEEAASRISDKIDEMTEALKTALDITEFTRKKPDYKGTSIHLQGLIKAVSNGFTDMKIFGNKKAGGRRTYGVTLLVDISLSMRGHLECCAIEALVMITEALCRLGIRNFSILLFGETVRAIKLPDTEWDATTIWNLLHNLVFDSDYATMDADAIDLSLDIIQATNARGPKKMFVLTDGYGTTGKKLARSLKRAEDEGVEVVALGVGCERTFVSKCYNKWITANSPSSLSKGLQALYEQEASALGPEHSYDDDMGDWYNLAPVPESAPETVEEVMKKRQLIFPGLLKQLQGERELKLVRGNRPSEMTVDLCFAIDCTGSMSPWIDAAKEQIKGIVGDIVPRINKEHKAINISLRLAMMVYRDREDPVQYDPLDFVTDAQQLYAHLSKQRAEGGDDGPECVLGALSRAADLDGWESTLKFLVLIADAPSHGRECTDDPDDRFPDGDPDEPHLTVDAVMRKIKEKKIELMFCRIKRHYTQKMEDQFRKFYDDDSVNKKLTTVDLFDASLVPVSTNGFHIVFCLDESGSMSGQKWKDLKSAYNEFLARRLSDQGVADIVSVVQFSHTARITEHCSPISQACAQAANLYQDAGGTCFSAGLEQAEKLFSQQPGRTPLLIFMSDGFDGGSDPVPIMRRMYSNLRASGLRAHTYGFGSRADSSLLGDMAGAAGGNYHPAAKGIDLIREFVETARGCSAMDGLLTRFGDIISGMVANKVILDHL